MERGGKKEETFHLERGRLGITVDFVAWLSAVLGVWGAGILNSLTGSFIH